MSTRRTWREAVPWWARMGAKVILARLPIGYGTWRRLGVFKHGRMLEEAYARDVFHRHCVRARDRLPAGYTVLELGPGDSLATAFVAHAAGASRTWLVDVGAFAEQDPAAYGSLLAAVPLESRSDMARALASSSAAYLTSGLASLREVPSGSVDLTFSHAVLEHVPLDAFDETIRELYRMQRPGGIGSHVIDLRDHLQAGLHSLRFSRRHWEGSLLRNSGFYTNRLRSPELRASFERAGYRVVQMQENRWERVPLPRRALHAEFQHFTDAELAVHEVELVVEKLPHA